ncbi:putative YkwD family protein [Orenia metallireducens]|jgi:uncharacterized YkwD family protein|uniref:Uncharacterized protein, YkwD family n=1 Tax=Orenia metallireducens TaxID=1413210 RepID=A0A285H227_9FIRM|nr:CAP domain-containing protein [Orenia metallireducens]PRX26464.1 putative YkwD family protein [Orenia metallireducens]SNY28806.1 uncharacterized protein, YkwD family [Orenia metallireducens]
MELEKIITWILIFALIMPTIVLVSTGTAYAFGGLDLDDNILNILKAFFALFFLGKMVGDKSPTSEPITDQTDNSAIQNGNGEQSSNSTSQEEIEPDNQTPSTESEDVTKDDGVEIIENEDWTEMKVYSLSRDEELMLDLLNKERIKEGLNPLKIDFRLVQVARAKSQNMIDEGYFSHFSPNPNYGSPFDMMKKLGIDYYLAGENIAGAPNVQWAHNSLMESPSHKDNILHPDYTHIGIGIVNGGPYGKMFSQEFADLVN